MNTDKADSTIRHHHGGGCGYIQLHALRSSAVAVRSYGADMDVDELQGVHRGAGDWEFCVLIPGGEAVVPTAGQVDRKGKCDAATQPHKEEQGVQVDSGEHAHIDELMQHP